jgi:hypothetical protein
MHPEGTAIRQQWLCAIAVRQRRSAHLFCRLLGHGQCGGGGGLRGGSERIRLFAAAAAAKSL